MNQLCSIPNRDYKVFVRCNTYNQSSYIKDALKGFVMQKTSFPFVCMIMDDFSTDGEQELLLEWAEEECETGSLVDFEIEDSRVVFARHKENANCYFAFYLLKRNTWKEREVKIKMYEFWRAWCEYEALCEGDDYWTDPLKLQKQVEILDTNPNIVICLHRVQTISADKSVLGSLIPRLECHFKEGIVDLGTLTREEFLDDCWCFHTSSFFIRTSHILHNLDFQKKHLPSFPYGDMPLLINCLQYGGYFLEDIMGCYRLMSGGWNSAMHENSDLKKKMERKVIEGFHEFDKYTNHKYHHEVSVAIRRKDYYIIHDGKSYLPKFWPIILKKKYWSIRGKISKCKKFILAR